MLTEINYCFSTAWSPCCPVVEEMAKQYPNLKFEHKYYEPGCGFAGKDTYENGELVDEEYYEMGVDNNSNNKYMRFLVEEFDEEFYVCNDCGTYMYEYELEDEEYKCINCKSTNIQTPDGERLTSYNYFQNFIPKKDKDGLLEVIRRVG